MAQNLTDLNMKGARWEGWIQESETLEFLASLKETVTDLQWDWVNRKFEADNDHLWIKNNAGALAAVEMLSKLIQKLEDIGAIEDGEQVGTDGQNGPSAGDSVQSAG